MMSLGVIDARAEENRLLHWLASDEVRSSDGCVVSWYNPAHPGYMYEEVTGYLMRLLAGCEADLDARGRARLRELQSRIEARLLERGALSRAGIDYVFDTAMGVAALCLVARGGGRIDRGAAQRGLDFVSAGLGASRAVSRDGAWFVEDRWSARWEPHLLKCAIALEDARAIGLHAGISGLELAASFLPHQREDGAFALHGSPGVDVHVHCYALEGLLRLRHASAAIVPAVRRGMAWLSSAQAADGGLPRFVGPDGAGACASDVTAQAMRLFLVVDSSAYEPGACAAWDWLSRHRDPERGFRYRAGCDDQPTWSAIFAAQALGAASGRDVEDRLV